MSNKPIPDPAVAEAFHQVAADRAAHRKTHAAQARRQMRALAQQEVQRCSQS